MSRMEVVLAIFKPGAERFTISLVGDVTVIGRQQDCDVRVGILDVSRKHCRLIKDDNTLEIEDLGSSNGTYLNGRRISAAMVTAGDVIAVGPIKFMVQIDGNPPDSDMILETAEPGEAGLADTATGAEIGQDEEGKEEEDDLVDFNLDPPPEESK
jgi:pSer/pThr/pTyr-binding forkhead associated (FHA) protein